jgi:Domain of unknown function (DUF932)
MSLYSNYLSKTRGAVALSDEELRGCAPSIFTSQPIDTVSNRYSFLPTSSILRGMRRNGWVPVRAEQQSVRTEARQCVQKHLIRFARAEHFDSWEKNQVRPEVVLLNSHDKSSAYPPSVGLRNRSSALPQNRAQHSARTRSIGRPERPPPAKSSPKTKQTPRQDSCGGMSFYPTASLSSWPSSGRSV